MNGMSESWMLKIIIPVVLIAAIHLPTSARAVFRDHTFILLTSVPKRPGPAGLYEYWPAGR